MVCSAYMDEYQKLVIRMDNPKVVIDNAVCPTATLVTVDSARKEGILLEAVQVLTDLDLSIKKAYISSDGRWFMDVFHVTDRFDRKLTDDSVITYLEQSLDYGDRSVEEYADACEDGVDGLTALELTGTDRPGLLSEVFAVLEDLQCAVVEAKVWTHGGRIACLLFVSDAPSGSPIAADEKRVRLVDSRLRHVLNGEHDVHGARTAISSMAVGHSDRRLHQMLLADRDYERTSAFGSPRPSLSPSSVSVQDWLERGYSIVNVRCRDRPKLLFDVVCTLMDMEYVVFHGTIDTDGDVARQEFYLRHKDGTSIRSEAERQRVIQCLQAAIERRSSEGLRLELCVEDRPGLLSEVTRTFRENGLLVRRAEISTKGSMVSSVFYLTDVAGQSADLAAVDAICSSIRFDCLIVKEEQRPHLCLKASDGRGEVPSGVGIGFFSLGSFVRRNLYNLGLIKSCS